jgi:hypothetical protein
MTYYEPEMSIKDTVELKARGIKRKNNDDLKKKEERKEANKVSFIICMSTLLCLWLVCISV